MSMLRRPPTKHPCGVAHPGCGRFNPQFRNVPGDDTIRTGQILDGTIERLRICVRYLRTSEAIANYRQVCR
jgi:hypothetical protein